VGRADFRIEQVTDVQTLLDGFDEEGVDEVGVDEVFLVLQHRVDEDVKRFVVSAS